MSYFLSFAGEGSDEITDTDTVATTRGWVEFGDFVERQGGRFPALSLFVEEGLLEGAEDIAALEKEVAAVVRERPRGLSPHDLSVARRLLEELRGRPEGTDEVCISDGTAGGGEDED